MAGWHHQLNGHEFEQALGVGDGQGGLACCSPWGRKELDMTERLNWTELNLGLRVPFTSVSRSPHAAPDCSVCGYSLTVLIFLNCPMSFGWAYRQSFETIDHLHFWALIGKSSKSQGLVGVGNGWDTSFCGWPSLVTLRGPLSASPRTAPSLIPGPSWDSLPVRPIVANRIPAELSLNRPPLSIHTPSPPKTFS